MCVLILLGSGEVYSQSHTYKVLLDSFQPVAFPYHFDESKRFFFVSKDIEGPDRSLIKWDSKLDSAIFIDTLGLGYFDSDLKGVSVCGRIGRAYNSSWELLFDGEKVDNAKEVNGIYIIKDLNGDFCLVEKNGQRIKTFSEGNKLIKEFNNKAICKEGSSGSSNT